jgi:hypothetical protein
MIFLAIGVFSLRILTGFLIIDWMWKTKTLGLFFLKISLSIGVGLGISSLGYFLYLMLFAGKHYFIYFEILILVILIVMRFRKAGFAMTLQQKHLTFIQISIISAAGFVFIASLMGLVNYVLHQQTGGWDSWMIFNRTARFIYRSQEYWRNAFSDKLDVIFHADYPPLLAMNIASAWDALGRESIYVPIMQSLLFSLACVSTIAFTLSHLKSISQAGIGVILLWGSPIFVQEGGSQTADIPLAFFMLASVVLYYLFKHERQPVLMVLGGFCAGLASWTKNEGTLFVLASIIAIIFTGIRERSFRAEVQFLMGLALPFGVTLYFKVFMAPASEFLRGDILLLALDISRHKIILASAWNAILHFGPEKLSIFPLLLFIYFIFQLKKDKQQVDQYLYALMILVIQFSGYYFLYLISPYDLVWHTSYSISRLLVHLYPVLILLILNTGKTPEEMFSTNSA